MNSHASIEQSRKILIDSRHEIARTTDNDGIEQSELTIAPLAAFAESKTGRKKTKRQVVKETIVVWRTHESENREERKVDLNYYEKTMYERRERKSCLRSRAVPRLERSIVFK
jgi:hypothetical protein